MKKTILHLAIFIFIFIIIDVSFGVVCDYLTVNAKDGDSGKRSYIVNETSEDILLFGSSRMEHHYNPQIFEDSLKRSCFNAGFDGKGIILYYGFFKLITERYKPKMIVYDLSIFDIYQDDNSKYTFLLKPFSKNSSVKDIITSVDVLERFKLKSNLYRYNSLWIGLLGSNIKKTRMNLDGFEPLGEIMDYEPNLTDDQNGLVDSLKVKYLKTLITDCKEMGVELVFVVSPHYKGNLLPEYIPEAKEIAKQYGIKIYDYFADSSVAHNKAFFKDQAHMNKFGADFFSKMFVSEIKKEGFRL